MKNNSVCSLRIGNSNNSLKNKVGEDGIDKLEQLLKTTNIMSLLDLRNLQINDYWVIKMSEGLYMNNCLSYLNLSKN